MGEIRNKDLNEIIEERLLSSDLTKHLTTEELTSILRISLSLGNIRHLPKIFNRIMGMINDLLGCQTSTLLLAHKSHNSFVRIITSGSSSLKNQQASVAKVSLDKGIAGWVYHNKKPAVVDAFHSIDNISLKSEEFSDTLKINSALAVPIIVNGKVKGVLESLNKQGQNKKFEERELNIANILSRQLAISLDTLFLMIEKSNVMC
ncbi:MAG: GAF domain-containing protein [Methylococcales bacterium]|nr:GAF domain-containing protein [Methylococcales bacterium]